MMKKVNKKMSWIEAIVSVLKSSSGAMHYTDIAATITHQGLVETTGNTVGNTVNCYIHQNKDKIVQFGKRGFYILKSTLDEYIKKYLEGNIQNNQPLFCAYGRFWDRKKIEKDKNAMIGISLANNNKIDFNNARGIYLLHRGYETVYVGQCSSSNFGKRIREHFSDSLARKWDSFSWFCIGTITEDKQIIPHKVFSLSNKDIINGLEALLIESIEPRFNDKKGNHLAQNEYQQF